MKKAIIAYIPVLHEGYRRFLEKHKKGADLFLFGPELISEFYQLSKEIRALEPELIKSAIERWGILGEVIVVDRRDLKRLKKAPRIIMPDEDICREIAQKYFKKKKIKFDQVFLRWDKHNTVKENPLRPNSVISKTQFDRQMMALAEKAGERSSDWWRRIGAIVVKNKKVLFTVYNHHMPSQHMPFVDGDPRSNFSKGINLELSTAIHAEAAAVAYAAKNGISLDDAWLYTTTFPCPPCAKIVAYSGIKRLYYRVGYGILDSESILKKSGVEIICVK